MKLQLIILGLSLLIPLSVQANTVIHGEFDYDINERKFTEWQLGPVFSIGEDTEIEIPIGQSDGEWQLLHCLQIESTTRETDLTCSMADEMKI